MTIIDISSTKEFNKYIKNKSNYNVFCFITSESEWCTSLNNEMNDLTKDIKNFNSGVIFTRVNVENNKLSYELEVASYPVVRIYKNGEVQDEIFCSYPNFLETMKEHFF